MKNTVWKKIPVAINNAWGDPLTESLVDNTVYKAKELYDHLAPIMICTKSVPNEATLEKLIEIKDNSNIFLVYSLTGINEGGFSLEQRRKAIEDLSKLFDKIAIITRPIISGVNDSKENLTQLVEIAENTSKILITGALHDKNKRKYTDESVMEFLTNLCERKGVKYYHKSSCAAADTFKQKCWVHDLSAPQNLDALDELGIPYQIKNNEIILPQATVGDMNFIRMLTHANVKTPILLSNYNILSISNESQIFETTSSWYAWSNNGYCSLNCPYCICNQIEYLDSEKCIGVNPNNLINFKYNSEWVSTHYSKENFLLKGDAKEIEYNNVRTIKKCMVGKYE